MDTSPGSSESVDENGPVTGGRRGRERRAAMYVKYVRDGLIEEEVRCQREVEADIAQLRARLDVANRRIRAASAFCCSLQEGREDGDGAIAQPSAVWIRSGRELLALQERLAACATDESMLMALVSEVRLKREELTNEALEYYADRTRKLFEDEDHEAGS